MTRTKSLALAFYLGAALAGAAIGVSVDRAYVRGQPPSRDPKAMRERFYDQLKLDASQRDSVTRIFDVLTKMQDSIRAPYRPSMDSASAQARQHIYALLTPEQRTIYDQIRRERERAQQRPETK
jgi:Spy/CpxP family protein refolding chaperone